jgi:ribosomal protein S14
MVIRQDNDKDSDAAPRPCRRCGKGDAVRFGDQWLCRECFQQYGSCCLEFGGDDLWKEREEEGLDP